MLFRLKGLRDRTFALALFLCLTGCGAHDEEDAKSLEIVEPVAYWSVRGKSGDNNYIRPLVRFKLANRGARPVGYVQTMAVFRRENAPNESWGNAFEYSVTADPIPAGGSSREIALRSDSSYFSKDEPEKMFASKEWEQVEVEIFVKVRASTWTSRGKVDVPQRIGAPGVEAYTDSRR